MAVSTATSAVTSQFGRIHDLIWLHSSCVGQSSAPPVQLRNAPGSNGCDLYMTKLTTKFDESRQDEQWRNEVAKELNILIGRAVYFSETSNDSSDQEAEVATLSIVQRVRDFEEIKTVEELDPAKHPRKVRRTPKERN